MNDTIILTNYNPFTMVSEISIFQDGVKKDMSIYSDLGSMVEALCGLSYGYKIYDLKIHAPNNILNELISEIHDFELNQYNENKIKIEGI